MFKFSRKQVATASAAAALVAVLVGGGVAAYAGLNSGPATPADGGTESPALVDETETPTPTPTETPAPTVTPEPVAPAPAVEAPAPEPAPVDDEPVTVEPDPEPAPAPEPAPEPEPEPAPAPDPIRCPEGTIPGAVDGAGNESNCQPPCSAWIDQDGDGNAETCVPYEARGREAVIEYA